MFVKAWIYLMEHIQPSFASERMMTTLLLWGRSLRTRLSLDINNFMKKKGFIDANEEKDDTVYGAALF